MTQIKINKSDVFELKTDALVLGVFEKTEKFTGLVQQLDEVFQNKISSLYSENEIRGKLGEVTSLIGINKGNITGVNMVEKTENHINFTFDIQIYDLKNFTKLISELKQKEFKFRIIRHKKKHALLQRFFKRFKKN